MSVSIRLVGGLGNQLFGYFAGRYIASKLSTDLVLDLSQQKHNQHESSSILDLDLVEHDEVTFSPSRERADRLISLIPLKWTKVSDVSQRSLKCFHSRGLGWDPRLESVEDGSVISGYFQTYKYFSSHSKIHGMGRLTPKNPSDWYLKMSEKARAQRPVAIHLRRSDYQREINKSIGVLSTRFHMDALDRLATSQGNSGSEVWVFSDDIKSASYELRHVSQKIRLIRPPSNSTAAESMSLFSSASSHIISNSTFSYWGAMFGAGSAVVAPEKWFYLWQDPKDLLPPHWITAKSYFQTQDLS